MVTILAKMLNYISANLLLYPILIFRVLFTTEENNAIWYKNIKPNLLLLFVLISFIIISLVWLLNLLHWKNNIRIKGKAKENITIEMLIFIATYIIPIIFIDTNWVGLVICIVVFIVFGFMHIVSDRHFLNPTFCLFGYKLYRLDDRCILYKKSIDSLNILFVESPDGICARELVRNTYIVLTK